MAPSMPDAAPPLKGSSDTTSVFSHVPAFNVVRPFGEGEMILNRAEPTKTFGVGIVEARSSSPLRSSAISPDQHGLWLHRSAPVDSTTRMGGRSVRHRSEPGSINIRPAGLDTITDVEGPIAGLVVRVSAECLAIAKDQVAAHQGTLVERLDARDPALVAVADSMAREAAAGHPNGALYWSSAADAFIGQLLHNHLSILTKAERGVFSGHEVARLDAFIRARLAEPLDIPTLAAVVDCDRFRFTRRFRGAVGVSPHRYVVRHRLRRACELIRTGREPLSQIAAATGFTDQSHLARWIRRIYNLRPTDLREAR